MSDHEHNLPDVDDLVWSIYRYSVHLRCDYDPEEITDSDSSEPGGDIRLQAVDGSWNIHTGDSCYDQDHRGHWGDAFVPADCSEEDAGTIARDLIEQVQNAIAESD